MHLDRRSADAEFLLEHGESSDEVPSDDDSDASDSSQGGEGGEAESDHEAGAAQYLRVRLNTKHKKKPETCV